MLLADSHLSFRMALTYFTIVLFIIVGQTSSLNAQYGEKLSWEVALEEFDHIVNTLLERHPAPYTHVNKIYLDSLQTALRASIGADTDQFALYATIRKFFAALADDHTLVYPSNRLAKDVNNQFLFLAYELVITADDRIFISANLLKRHKIEIGTEVLKINGMSSQEFIKRASEFVPCYNRESRNRQISEDFDMLLALIFPDERETQVRLSGRRSGQQLLNKIKPRKYFDLEFRKKRRAEYIKRLMKLEIKKNVAHLRLYSFSIYNLDWYRSELDKVFKKIRKKKVSDLIIDVRGNSGGNPKSAIELIHYFSDVDFKYYNTIYESRFALRDSLPFLDRALDAIPQFENTASYLRFEEGKIIQHKSLEYEFDGQVYVLVDRGSLSASAGLAAVVKCFDMGVLLGETTGGARVFHGHSLMEFRKISDLVVRTALDIIYTACSGLKDQDGHKEGVVPDVTLTRGTSDLMSGRDTQLKYVLDIIKENRSSE